jgi:signal peptidase II
MIVCVIVLDQLSKYAAVRYLKPIGTYPLLQDVFHLTFARNTGAAFSILRGKQIFLIGLTLIVIAFLTGYLIRLMPERLPLVKWSLVLVIGGAVGNLIDRMRLGYVVDFFDFRLINFAIFNVADIAIVVGTILLSLAILFTELPGISSKV